MKIKSKRLWLRPIKETDKEKLRQWRNDHREIFFDDREITIENQEKWFKKYKGLLSAGTDFMFISTLHSGEEIGTIALYDINLDDRTATIGRILLLEKYRGKGYAQEMVDLLCEFAFETIRVHKLVVETDLTNNAAISIYHKARFNIIGMRFLPVSNFQLLHDPTIISVSCRIIIIMERINPDCDPKKPLKLISLED